jgi:hypothetical protein
MNRDSLVLHSRRVLQIVARGAAAGAAGTTALNAMTYLDMSIRGRPASDTPKRTVGRVAQRIGITVPGDEEALRHRQTGIAALGGLATGIALGVFLAGVRAIGLRPGPVVSGALAGATAMVGANSSMVALGITDPRDWRAADWVADGVPHLAYGIVADWLLRQLDRS